ncbi:hypothetical protein DPMN_023418 [Dreissena polymorpha]|uniref:Uncharacterized protein n=1 Tax=Dreissena polymorpha TaxID=45954 RepID=A0A9D4LMY2_DREPO|nr:hypothetical protein DPMN_023418 [Dreissena polymorpha]
MTQSVLNNLLCIKLEAPVEHFDPPDAVHNWNTSGVRMRRPMFKDNKSKEPIHTFNVVNVDDVENETDSELEFDLVSGDSSDSDLEESEVLNRLLSLCKLVELQHFFLCIHICNQMCNCEILALLIDV